MGTMTLDDFRSDLRLQCGGLQATNPVWTQARLDRRINASYLWCSMPNHYRHPELEITEPVKLTTGNANYPLTNTYYMIVGVAHAQAAVPLDTTRRTKLYPVDWREQMFTQRPTSRPSQYSYWDEQIWLTSVPDTASVGQILEVSGYLQPDALALAADTTLLKAEWDEIILVGAEWRMWISMNEPDRAYEAKNNLGALVNEVADFRKLHGEEWGWQTGSDQYPGYMRTE